MYDGPLRILPLQCTAKVTAHYVLLEQAISRGHAYHNRGGRGRFLTRGRE
jgi:hypothetical protein